LTGYGIKSFQITLDGDKDVHNTTRIKANGRGTFDEIWSNLIDAANSIFDFSITLRIHVTASNHESVYWLLDKINAQFGADSRFSIYFHKVNDLSGAGGKYISYAEYGKIVRDLAAYADKLKGISSGDASEGDIKSESDLVASGYICYAAKPNSLLIRADGRIGKCTVAFSDERNTVGRINEDGTMLINNENFSLWLKGFEDMDQKFLSCPYSRLEKKSDDKGGVSLKLMPV
jgi:uncharacterized protein